MGKLKHTVLPWAVEDDQASISARRGEDWIADCNQLNGLSHEECEANAAYIVKACNAFPDLVKALEMARARIEYLGAACASSKHFEANYDTFLPAIDAVLSRVKGAPDHG